jgi:hypothetical protein
MSIDVLFSEFSNDAQSILVVFDSELELINQSMTSTQLCEAVMNNSMATGSAVADFTGAQCFFESDEHLLKIVLSQQSAVLPDDQFVLTPTAVLESVADNFTHEWIWEQDDYQLNVDISRNPTFPKSKITGVNQVGSCTDVALSSLSSTQLGYTVPHYRWECTSHPTLTNGSFGFSVHSPTLTIPYTTLATNFSLDTAYSFNLTITNVLGKSNTVSKDVYVSSDAVPVLYFSKCPSVVTLSSLLDAPLSIKAAGVFDAVKAFSCFNDSENTGARWNEWAVQIDIVEKNVDGDLTALLTDSSAGRLSIQHDEDSHPFSYGVWNYTATARLYNVDGDLVSSAADECLVDVVPSDVQVFISGGDKKFNLHNGEELVLDASGTADNDDPDSGANELSFLWTCTVLEGVTGNECDFMAFETTTNDILTIDTNALSVDVFYRFDLEVHHPATNRTSTDSVYVETFSDRDDLSLDINLNSPGSTIGSGQKLPLSGPPELKAADGYTFSWRAWEFTGEPQWENKDEWATDEDDIIDDLQLINNGGPSSNNIVVAPESLTPAKHYVFELTITDAGGNQGTAMTHMKVNPAPLIIEFSIEKLSDTGAFDEDDDLNDDTVYALYTELTASMEYSPAEDSDMFKYSYSQDGGDTWQPLSDVFEPTLSGFVLPSGDTVIRGCVVDVYKSRTCSEVPFTVAPLNLTKIGGECRLKDDMIKRIQTTNEQQSQLISTTLAEMKVTILANETAHVSDHENATLCVNSMMGTFQEELLQISNDSVTSSLPLTADDLESLIHASYQLITIVDDDDASAAITDAVQAVLQQYALTSAGDLAANHGLLAAIQRLLDTIFSSLELVETDDLVGEGNCGSLKNATSFHNRAHDAGDSAEVDPTEDGVSTLDLYNSRVCGVVRNVMSVTSLWTGATLDYLATDELSQLKTQDSAALSIYANQFDGTDDTNLHLDDAMSLNVSFPSALSAALSGEDGQSLYGAYINVENSSLFHACMFPSLDSSVCPVSAAVVDVTIVNQTVQDLADGQRVSVGFSRRDVGLADVPLYISEGNVYSFGSGRDRQCFRCAWYDENKNKWKYDGCETTLSDDGSSVVCQCNHLTKFTVANGQCDMWYWTHGQIVIGVIMSLVLCVGFVLLVGALLHYGLSWSLQFIDNGPTISLGIFSIVVCIGYVGLVVASLLVWDYRFIDTWKNNPLYWPEYVEGRSSTCTCPPSTPTLTSLSGLSSRS